MGEIIQYEGVAYKKVDRKAKAGDVVILKGHRSTINWTLEPGIHYPVIGMMGEPAVRVNGYIVHIYEGPWSGEYYSAVADVYERSPFHDIERQIDLPLKGLQHFADPEPMPELSKTMQHLAHPFYKEAREYWQDVQDGQIYKGAEKYGEPFTPSSWTVSELLEHAMQENVDQAHYIYGMYQKVQEMEKELKELREFRDQVQKTVVKWGAMNETKSGNA